jgi:AAA+ superfamily predicted ATPase
VREKKSTLIVFGGLSGPGKTTLAKVVAQEHSATYLRIDTIERALRSSGVLAGDDAGSAGYLLPIRWQRATCSSAGWRSPIQSTASR